MSLATMLHKTIKITDQEYIFESIQIFVIIILMLR